MTFIDTDLNNIFAYSKEKRKVLKVNLYKTDRRLRKHPINRGNTRRRKNLVKKKVRLEKLIKVTNQSLLKIIAHCLNMKNG